MYENKTICGECGGECCKHLPGACYPEDFGVPLDESRLAYALASGRYAIDWWEGDPRPDSHDLDDERDRTYFVRPATKGREGTRFDGSWGGECTFLGSEGCDLPEDARPLECKSLEPRIDGKCVMHNSRGKQEAAILWLEFEHLLDED